jgi:hypothetical protein
MVPRALSEFDASLVLDDTKVMSGKVADRGHVLATRVVELARLVWFELSRFIREVLRFHQIALYVRALVLTVLATIQRGSPRPRAPHKSWHPVRPIAKKPPPRFLHGNGL